MGEVKQFKKESGASGVVLSIRISNKQGQEVRVSFFNAAVAKFMQAVGGIKKAKGKVVDIGSARVESPFEGLTQLACGQKSTVTRLVDAGGFKVLFASVGLDGIRSSRGRQLISKGKFWPLESLKSRKGSPYRKR